MHILILGDTRSAYWPGSATLYIEEHLPAAIADSDPTLHIGVFTPFPTREIMKFLLHPWQVARTGSVESYTGGILWLCLHLIRGRFDLLHCLVIRRYMGIPFLCAMVAGIRTVTTLHDTLFLQRSEPMMVALVKRLLLRCSRTVLTLSRSDEQRVEKVRGKGWWKTVRNGIGAVGPLQEPSHRNIIIFGGGIGNEHSGLAFLDRALSGWKEAPELVIFGTNAAGQHDPRYKGMVTREVFHADIASARCVVVPSRYESFSMTALESMALGIPVIISDQCGITRYLTDGYDCVMVPYNDHEALRHAINRIMADDTLWMTVSRNGQRTAESFLWHHVAPDYAAAYRHTAAGVS